jgi:hypothetical protein
MLRLLFAMVHGSIPRAAATREKRKNEDPPANVAAEGDHLRGVMIISTS